MRPGAKFFILAAVAVGLWLADSCILFLGGTSPFLAALWTGVSARRLLLRLAVVVLLLLFGVMLVIRSEAAERFYQTLSPRKRVVLFGDENSSRTPVRLHYHCLRLAAVMGMRPREQALLRLLCYCHDIGMVGVPDAVLEKSPPLSPEDQALMDRHIDLGAAIARSIPQLRRVAPLIAAHEEFFDGSGAKGLRGSQIPLACRIFKLVQMYDFFTHPHFGGRVLEEKDALDELELYAGQVLDPEVVTAFRRLMTDGRLAETVAQHIFAS